MPKLDAASRSWGCEENSREWAWGPARTYEPEFAPWKELNQAADAVMFQHTTMWLVFITLVATQWDTSWLVVYLPLWKIWVRQLGSWNFQYMESPKIPWFQTTNQHHHDFDASYKLEQACCRSGSSKCWTENSWANLSKTQGGCSK